jgi:hypothetical protein
MSRLSHFQKECDMGLNVHRAGQNMGMDELFGGLGSLVLVNCANERLDDPFEGKWLAFAIARSLPVLQQTIN